MNKQRPGAHLEALAARYLRWLLPALAALSMAYSAWCAGPLWRDEVNSLVMARMPWPELWSSLHADSSPILHYTLFKFWLALPGFPSDIVSLRVLGLLIGWSCILAYCLVGKKLKMRGASLFFALFFFNPAFIRAIISARPYGLSVLLLLTTVGAYWGLLQRPGRKKWLLAWFLGALLAQTHYLNALLLIVIAAGAVYTSRASGEKARISPSAASLWRCTFFSLLTMVPYLWVIWSARSWLTVTQTSVGFFVHLWDVVRVLAVGSPWALFLAVLGGVLLGLQLLRRHVTTGEAKFALCFGLGVPVVYLAYMMATKLGAHPWYLAPPMAVGAFGGDVLLNQAFPVPDGAAWPSHLAGRLRVAARYALPVATGLVMLLCLPQNLRVDRWRQTNLDTIAARLQKLAGPNDYIVVAPWYYGVGFNYYYQGTTRWQTMPPLADQEMHHFDILVNDILTANGTNISAPVLQEARRTLEQGHTLWIVGQPVEGMIPGEPESWPLPIDLPLVKRFDMATYMPLQELSRVINEMASDVQSIDVPTGVDVSPYEQPPLFKVTGKPVHPTR